ncbi:MAG: hypothetical protein IJ575_06970 [Selenomonadaceae bacterium]|nr:hypothetical protein [Selenomonadaceae bacterium]
MDFIISKRISKSVLEHGISLSQFDQKKFAINLNHGEKFPIRIFYLNRIFNAVIRNVGFDRAKDPNHVPIWRIEYRRDLKDLLKLTTDQFLSISPTESRDLFILETHAEIDAEEFEIEHALEDESAKIVERFHLGKFRKLNREIGNQLKSIYDFRCQICGKNFGESYGTNLVEAHHIEFFSKSYNNNSENLLIVCPNHHRIIHAVNPIFDRDLKLYRYSNGFSEPLILNMHL